MPEFKDTLDRPAWWFKEQWLKSRTDWSKVRKPMTEEMRRRAYAREGIPYPGGVQSAPERPDPVATAPAPLIPPPPASKPSKAAHTYLLGIEGSPLVKIGHTTVSPKARMAALQTGQPMQLSLLWSCEGNFEADLHVHFAPYRVRGEWFDLTSLGDAIDVVKAAVGEIEAARA